MKPFLLVALLGLATLAQAQSYPGESRFNKNYEEEAPWKEEETELPGFPQDANLIEFYVSAVATNRYLIDAASLRLGNDGVVRYSLLVITAGGARNISHEGIHCKERRWKLYATGSQDTWSKARISEWRPIENKPINRHHAALSREFFCPQGGHILSADEGRNALRLGKHPSVN